MGAKIKDQIREEYEIEDFADEKFDSALIGVVEGFGAEFEPLYDWEIMKKLPIPHDRWNEFNHSMYWKMSLEEISNKFGDALIATGYDDQIMGVVSKTGVDTVVLYDREAVLEKKRLDIVSDEDYEEDPEYPAYISAIEDYEFNFIGGYLGPKTWKCAILFTEDE